MIVTHKNLLFPMLRDHVGGGGVLRRRCYNDDVDDDGSLASAIDTTGFFNTLQWLYTGVIASWITGKSTTCSIACSDKENIKAPHYWPALCEGNTPVSRRWIHLTKGTLDVEWATSFTWSNDDHWQKSRLKLTLLFCCCRCLALVWVT